jgi:hypothetical protein
MSHNVREFTPVLSTSAYAAGDVLFTATVKLQDVFPHAADLQKNVPAVHLHSINIVDKDDQTAYDIDVVFLRSNVSLGTVNAAISISDANAVEIVGVVQLTAASHSYDLINSKVYHRSQQAFGVMGGLVSSRDLYVSAVVRSSTPTHTASGQVWKIVFDVADTE